MPVDATRRGRRTGWVDRIVAAWEDEGSVLQRQVPFGVLFGLSLLALLAPGLEPTSTLLVGLAAGVVVVLAAAALVLPWRRLPTGARLAMPTLQLLAYGLLREGTGGPGTPFGSLLFLPVVLAASERGRRGVVLSTVASVVIILSPAVAAGGLRSPAEGVRAAFVALCVLAVGITVNVITERMRARTQAVEALRATEARLLESTQQAAAEVAARTEDVQRARDLFESVIDAATEQSIIGTDTRGVVDLYNPGAERLLGWARHEVVGRRRVTDLHLPEEVVARRDALDGAPDAGTGLFVALVGEALTGGSDVRDWTYVRSDGSTVVVRVAVTRRVDRGGATSGYIFVATDMSAEREAARLKDEFVSLISHELRTPLTSILGYLELTVESGDLTAEQRRHLGVVERNADRLLRLVGDLLFTAQVESGTFALVRQPVDLAGLVRATVETAGPAADAAGVVLSATGTGSAVRAEVDPVRLGQALDNLVSNAVKFTPRGGRVVVDLSVRDAAATITVSDTGIGIPAPELDQLFSRFFRASTATRNAVPGVGLGLTITRAILAAHGGTLLVRSTVGEGSTFHATVPLVPADAGSPGEGSPPAPAHRPRRRPDVG